MIDIDKLELRMTRRDDEPLLPPSPEEVLEMIAEIRRLRAHRKCPCGGDPVEHEGLSGNFWIDCDYCDCGTNTEETSEEAWAAWDGVE